MLSWPARGAARRRLTDPELPRYGFNPGSALALVGTEGVVGQAAITTTLSACAAAISTMVCAALFTALRKRSVEYDLTHTGNGALAGLVAITAGCAVVPQ